MEASLFINMATPLALVLKDAEKTWPIHPLCGCVMFLRDQMCLLDKGYIYSIKTINIKTDKFLLIHTVRIEV